LADVLKVDATNGAPETKRRVSQRTSASFLRKTHIAQKERAHRGIGTVVAKEQSNKKGRYKGKSGQAQDCGEWKLWGRRPLTI
jgi:hypothetical protein